MNIDNGLTRTPYTYLLGWRELYLWYYGVRYSKDCHPTDLWVKYKSSSKIVKRLYEALGTPDVIQVRKTFVDTANTLLWEYKVLHRLDAVKSSKWINQQNAGREFCTRERTMEQRQRQR